jgi:hypothetical protein
MIGVQNYNPTPNSKKNGSCDQKAMQRFYEESVSVVSSGFCFGGQCIGTTPPHIFAP